jgi:hypothetical protein
VEADASLVEQRHRNFQQTAVLFQLLQFGELRGIETTKDLLEIAVDGCILFLGEVTVQRYRVGDGYW